MKVTIHGDLFINLEMKYIKTWGRTKAKISQCAGNGNFLRAKYSIYLGPYTPLLDLGRFCSFLILYTVGRTPWTGDQPVARPLPTHRTPQTRNKRIQTSMPCVGFEPTIPDHREMGWIALIWLRTGTSRGLL
jgi:hypothetical protein